MRCRRSLPLAVGRCGCCHHCCQLGAGHLVASRPAPCRGWPASGAGGLRPGPCVLTGVSAEVSRIKRDFACTFARHLPPVLVAPAVTVTLEAGGADTYTQRAIPGSEPIQDSRTCACGRFRYRVAFRAVPCRAGPTAQALFGCAKRCNVDSPHLHSFYAGSTQLSLVSARLASGQRMGSAGSTADATLLLFSDNSKSGSRQMTSTTSICGGWKKCANGGFL